MTFREDAVEMLGKSSSARIARMVKDVVTETQNGGLTEIRMSDAVLAATLRMRAFLFEAVYENEVATAEFKKATGILGGLWEKVRERPAGLLDERIVATRGARCRRPRLPGRHERPLRGLSLRAALHPKALGGADGLESAIITGRLSRDFRERGTGHAAGPHPVSSARQPVRPDVPPNEVEQEGDAYRVVAPVEWSLEIHKDKDRFRLDGTARTELELACGRCLEPFRMPFDGPIDVRYLPAHGAVDGGRTRGG